MSRLLIAILLVTLLQLADLPSIHAKASPVARLYIVGGGQVEELNALTLASLPPNGDDIANRLHGASRSSQVVQSPDGSRLGIIRGNTRAGSQSTLTIINVRNNTVVRKDSVSALTLLGVSNDGEGWYGTYTTHRERDVQFVSARFGKRHTLVFRLPQPCCVLFQYDPRRDRLYALTLQTTSAGPSPEVCVITAWQVASRRRLASLRITGMVSGTSIHSSFPQVQRVIPGFALSPDGRTLAVLDYVDQRLDTVDALRLRWTRNPFIRGAGDIGTTVGPSVIPSPRISGTEGFDINAQFSLDGKILYQEGTANVDHKTSFIFSEAMLTKSIDVAHSVVRGVIGTPLVAPLRVGTDGTAVYTAVIRGHGTHVVVLVQRRRSTNLSVIAQRSIVPFARTYMLLALSE